MDVLLKFLISNVFVFVLWGCVTAAPELPPDYYSVDSGMKLDESSFQKEDIERECQNILEEKAELAEIRKKIDEVGTEGRERDQILGFLAALTFVPALVVASNNDNLEGQIETIQIRYDEINRLIKFKECAE